jgi:hypothetical protein
MKMGWRDLFEFFRYEIYIIMIFGMAMIFCVTLGLVKLG